jgi:hypothetical protein
LGWITWIRKGRGLGSDQRQRYTGGKDKVQDDTALAAFSAIIPEKLLSDCIFL